MVSAKQLFGYIIGLIIILLLLLKVEVELLKVIIHNIMLPLIIPVIILQIILIFLTGIKLYFLLAARFKISLKQAIKYQVVQYISSTILPMTASAIPVIYLLKKEKQISPGVASSNIIIDKSISLFIILLLVILAAVYYGDSNILLAALFLMLLGILGSYASFYSKTARHFFKILIPKKIKPHLKGITANYRFMLRHKRDAILKNILTTVIFLTLNGLFIKLIFALFTYSIPLIDVILISSILQLSVLFPITPSGVGVRQAAGVYLYGALGVPATFTLVMYFVVFLLRYGFAALFSILLSHKA